MIIAASMCSTRASTGRETAVTLRGWTGEFLQVREIEDGTYGLWHPDGAYFGRLVPDAAPAGGRVSGTVFGPTGLYLADAAGGRLRVDPRRRVDLACGRLS